MCSDINEAWVDLKMELALAENLLDDLINSIDVTVAACGDCSLSVYIHCHLLFSVSYGDLLVMERGK